jgi:hypothetical protein
MSDEVKVLDAGEALDASVRQFQNTTDEHAPKPTDQAGKVGPPAARSGFVAVTDFEAAKQDADAAAARANRLEEQIRARGGTVDGEGNLLLAQEAAASSPDAWTQQQAYQQQQAWQQQQQAAQGQQIDWTPMVKLAENFGVQPEEFLRGIAPALAAVALPLYQRAALDAQANVETRLKSRLAEQALLDGESSVYLRSLQSKLQELDPATRGMVATDDSAWQAAVDWARGRHFNDIISHRGSQPTVRGVVSGRVMEGAAPLIEGTAGSGLPPDVEAWARRNGFDDSTVAAASRLRQEREKRRDF